MIIVHAHLILEYKAELWNDKKQTGKWFLIRKQMFNDTDLDSEIRISIWLHYNNGALQLFTVSL